jgi:hypothetical protein
VDAKLKLILALVLGLAVISVAECSEKTQRIVLASDILAKIKAGEPVKYDHVRIDGDLRLDKLNLPIKYVDRTWLSTKLAVLESAGIRLDIGSIGISESMTLVSSLIEINNSEINGSVNFNNTLFQQSVNFNNTVFLKGAYFGGSQFNRITGFPFSKFKGNAIFWVSHFDGFATFAYSQFYRDAAFRNSQFNSTANFHKSQFDGGYADFKESQFNSDAYFIESQFSNYADFSRSQFNGIADFFKSSFNAFTYFEETSFNGEARFEDAQFNGTSNFDSSQFKEDALFGKTAFRDKLSLSRTRYNKLFIRWNNIERALTYDDAAYLALLKNFKDLGYFEDYDGCYFQYRKEHRGQLWNTPGEPFLKFVDFLSEWSYGYGVRPMNPLLISIMLVVLFGLFWRSHGIGRTDGHSDKYNLENDPLHNRSHIYSALIGPQTILDVLAPFTFSFILFISAGKFLVDTPELSEPMRKPKSWTKRMFDLEKFLGGIFLALFFISLSSTIIRSM